MNGAQTYNLIDVYVHVRQDANRTLSAALWVRKRAFLPMLRATNVFAC